MQERERAYHALEQQLLTAPWALTENFVSSMQEHKCVLEVNGAVGDPTAGRGFSYLREVRKVCLPQRQPHSISLAQPLLDTYGSAGSMTFVTAFQHCAAAHLL